VRRTPSSRTPSRPSRNPNRGAADLFEGRFSEILIIFVLALIVLGPEKLPRVVSELGRWVGRARGMARQFREQLEEEVQLEEARKAAPMSPPPAPAPAAAPSAAAPASAVPTEAPAEAAAPPRAPTFSHAHPTDDTGADTTVRTATASADEQRT
jgi:sec-independent protein translocase protein TatB